MLIISSREFRGKQKEYFDRVDRGEQIIVQRNKDKAYTLTPITEEDIYFTPAMMQRIEQAIQEAKDGKVTSLENKEEIRTLLGL